MTKLFAPYHIILEFKQVERFGLDRNLDVSEFEYPTRIQEKTCEAIEVLQEINYVTVKQSS